MFLLLWMEEIVSQDFSEHLFRHIAQELHQYQRHELNENYQSTNSWIGNAFCKTKTATVVFKKINSSKIQVLTLIQILLNCPTDSIYH